MSRRTHGEVAHDAAIAERAAVLRFFGAQRQAIAVLVERGQMDGDSASLLATRLTTMAEQIGQGLHHDGQRRL